MWTYHPHPSLLAEADAERDQQGEPNQDECSLPRRPGLPGSGAPGSPLHGASRDAQRPVLGPLQLQGERGRRPLLPPAEGGARGHGRSEHEGELTGRA
jgi:hypothetical protein